ncbi:cytochrome P450 [Aspergillus affinis]|uniref:cytochrome P450 n=1 Tax=Aspergillus affinis TaxID=1070780 RepID=UPI0022FE6BA7|nr:cytochrome P450 [Aspergillus affinis]KAI9037703.1 cytochrome P450 [Aspergillus affinis]
MFTAFTTTVCLGGLSAFLYSLYHLVTLFLHTRRSKKLSCQPCLAVPSGFLGIRLFLDVRNAHRQGQVANKFRSIHLQNGNTVRLDPPGGKVILTCEPDNIQAILASQFSSFGLSYFRHRQYHPLFGDGIFTSDGKRWEGSRKLLRPQFARSEIPEIGWFDDHVKRFIGALPPDGQVFDSQELFFRLALDAATDFLFGESVYSLSFAASNQTGVAEASCEGRQGFAEAFDYSQYVLFQRTIALHLYWLVNPSKFRQSNKIVHRFVDYYVDKALRQAGREKADSQQRYCFLQALAGQSKDAKVLRDQMVNVLLASRDDTASLLSSIFYFLARHQDTWEKLKAEVRQTAHAGPVTLKEVQSLPYLRAVINEALRLFPPVPINARVAHHDTTIPVGGGPDGQAPVYIKKGQSVVYSVWSVHRRTDIWGPDAEVFRPERWEERKQNAWEFLPFNGGPRACLGQQFAVVQASHLIFRIAQEFETLENAGPGPDLGTHPPMRQTLTMCHQNGVHVRLYRNRA